jgi:hypothetical protein
MDPLTLELRNSPVDSVVRVFSLHPAVSRAMASRGLIFKWLSSYHPQFDVWSPVNAKTPDNPA